MLSVAALRTPDSVYPVYWPQPHQDRVWSYTRQFTQSELLPAAGSFPLVLLLLLFRSQVWQIAVI